MLFLAGGLVITRNIGAWSQVANMLYIDSPAGVGLSVAAHSEDTVTNDTQTATDTNTFLRKWFRKYDAFQKHEFFISGVCACLHWMCSVSAKEHCIKLVQPTLMTVQCAFPGESYAGVYVPTLVQEVLRGNAHGELPHLNLQVILCA